MEGAISIGRWSDTGFSSSVGSQFSVFAYINGGMSHLAAAIGSQEEAADMDVPAIAITIFSTSF